MSLRPLLARFLMLLAVAMLAAFDRRLAAKVAAFRRRMAAESRAKNRKL